MKYDPEKHRRRSIRLPGYDYANPGAYFVTFCAQNRQCLFGAIVDHQMVLNEAGRMVCYWWDELNNKYPTAKTDAFVVMSNHVHGIIRITEPTEFQDTVRRNGTRTARIAKGRCHPACPKGIENHQMKHDPEKHHRRSIRLPGYDYANPGAYFVTVCAQNRECLFGAILDRQMVLNEAGRMVCYWWEELNNKYPTAKTDAFVIMPNHMHGIIRITEPHEHHGTNVGADRRVCPKPGHQTGSDRQVEHTRGEHKPDVRRGGEQIGSPLPRMVQWFKTMTTNAYIRGVKQEKWPPFAGKLWQRNYYERIIRNEDELNRIREYVIYNPQKWEEDRENPCHVR